MAKEGIGVILAIMLFTIIFFIGARFTGHIVFKVFFVLGVLFIFFTLYFFRDPARKTPQGENLIISPADGKIILIEKVQENEFFKGPVRKISIFMSAFNVHVNRNPIDGKVVFFNYKKGSFHQAFKDDASYENEQTIIGVENKKIKILFKQIAGIFARRIVCYIREGNEVKQGEKFGLIKFGSRMDVFMPLSVEIKVSLKQKVKAGETILGIYN